MQKRIVVSIFVVILTVGGICLLFYNPSAPPEYPQVYIHSDGTVEPSSTPIHLEGNLYTLQNNIALEKLFIEKSHITLVGNGFFITIVGPTGKGGLLYGGTVEVKNVENVTLRNLEFEGRTNLTFDNASACQAVNNSISKITINNSQNILLFNQRGSIELTNSKCCTISSSQILMSEKLVSLTLANSHYNKILNNSMTTMKVLALRYENSNNNLFFGNRIEQTQTLFEITGTSTGNLFVGNYIQGAFSHNPTLSCSGINTFYHNNLFYVYWNRTETATTNLWDNGSEGNYWNTYQGEDANGDGIGDTPHQVDVNNQDRYPLMNPLNLNAEPQPPLSPP